MERAGHDCHLSQKGIVNRKDDVDIALKLDSDLVEAHAMSSKMKFALDEFGDAGKNSSQARYLLVLSERFTILSEISTGSPNT